MPLKTNLNDDNVTSLCPQKLIISSYFLISTCPKRWVNKSWWQITLRQWGLTTPNHQSFHKGWRKVLHFTKHYIKVHKNYLVWVQDIEREKSLDQFTFQICASHHNDVATHLKSSPEKWPFQSWAGWNI